MNFRNILLATAGTIALALNAPAAASPMPLDAAAKLFATRSTAFSADLSPSGAKALYLGSGPGAVTYLHVVNLANRKDEVIAQSNGKPEQLSSCGFVDDKWAICYFHGDMVDDGMTLAVSRVVAIDTTTGEVIRLGAAERGVADRFVQYDGRVIDWLPRKPGSILMQRTYSKAGNGDDLGYGVDEIQLEPFKVTKLEHQAGYDVDYMTDGAGNVRFRSRADVDEGGRLTGKTSYEFRRAGTTQWVPLGDGGEDFSPLLVDAQLDSLFFTKPVNGRAALMRIKLDGSNAETLVASNPKVDIDSLITLGVDNKIVGYRYTDDMDRSVYLDPAIDALDKKLSAVMPDLPSINMVAQNRDGSKMLIHGSSDVDPGAYFLLDTRTNEMSALVNSNDFINASMLAPMKPVAIPMSDGKSIPAYLTMRADLGQGAHPTVVLPHGGPTSRDTWGYDWLAQFLAARGYVVVQPNYRGSSGYGKDFLGENAFHEWKQVMADIRDTADWLQKEGIADPNRMAILGWSYGGYAALESAALDPRYKAVVAVAPVTDLKQLVKEHRGFTSEKLVKDEVGKGDQFAEGSPINRASEIHAPVLLVHGTLDGNVGYAQSKRMLGALQRAGNRAELMTIAGLDHQLADSTARAEMLTKIGTLLKQTIGE